MVKVTEKSRCSISTVTVSRWALKLRSIAALTSSGYGNHVSTGRVTDPIPSMLQSFKGHHCQTINDVSAPPSSSRGESRSFALHGRHRCAAIVDDPSPGLTRHIFGISATSSNSVRCAPCSQILHSPVVKWNSCDPGQRVKIGGKNAPLTIHTRRRDDLLVIIRREQQALDRAKSRLFNAYGPEVLPRRCLIGPVALEVHRGVEEVGTEHALNTTQRERRLESFTNMGRVVIDLAADRVQRYPTNVSLRHVLHTNTRAAGKGSLFRRFSFVSK